MIQIEKRSRNKLLPTIVYATLVVFFMYGCNTSASVPRGSGETINVLVNHFFSADVSEWKEAMIKLARAGGDGLNAVSYTHLTLPTSDLV